MKTKKVIRKVLLALLCLSVIGCLTVFSVNAYVIAVGKNSLLTPQEAAELTDVDCILVLGCQVRADGSPSNMLSDRIDRGIQLYELGAAPKLLMSGDHGREDYDEVGTMKQVAIDAGVPSPDVFKDHAGFSTYESLYRAREIFGAEKIIIVTQEYHLYRALYIAKALGIEAYGVASDSRTYPGQSMREAREILARNKDFVMSIFKPKPSVMGEAVPVSGDGDITNSVEL